MDATRRRLRRRQLDQQLSAIQSLSVPPTPNGGWIRAIREALGMSLESFGQRLGVSRQTAHELSKAEQDGSLTIRRLRSAADALNCDLIVLVVPRQPLEQTVMDRARVVAREQVMRTSHSMALEEQSLSNESLDQMIHDVVAAIIDESHSRLWA